MIAHSVIVLYLVVKSMLPYMSDGVLDVTGTYSSSAAQLI
jgi:hypothetical protein